MKRFMIKVDQIVYSNSWSRLKIRENLKLLDKFN